MSDSGHTLLVLYPGCIAYEIHLAAELLHEHLPVEVATPDGEDHVSSSGLRIAADLAYRDVDIARYRVVLVPGGDCEAVLDDGDLASVLQRANDSGVTIGAICAAPLLISKAGVLAGRRFTHGFKTWHQEFLAPFWDGATFVDDILVRDGNLITAMAEGHVDFAIELLDALGLVDETTRERRRQFYKGVVQAPLPQPIPT